MLALVEQSHLKMCPDVPFAGWDVVFSADPKVPVCLLEVNLSCNFFRGSFDKKVGFLGVVNSSCVWYCFSWPWLIISTVLLVLVFLSFAGIP